MIPTQHDRAPQYADERRTYENEFRTDGAATLPVEAALRALNSWFWLSAIMGFGRRYLSCTNCAPACANEAVLPFYILHRTVIVVVAYFLVGWAVAVPVKYAALAVSSFALIVLLYGGVVRRVGALRFLFGMKEPRS